MGSCASNTGLTTLNSNLNTKQNTITLTPFNSSNATFENGGYFKIGNMVIFDTTLVIGSGGATTGVKLLDGFPTTSQNDKPMFGMMMGSVNNDLKSFRIYQTGLYPNMTMGAGRYHVYGMYISVN